jgi:hypothetical protein
MNNDPDGECEIDEEDEEDDCDDESNYETHQKFHFFKDALYY